MKEQSDVKVLKRTKSLPNRTGGSRSRKTCEDSSSDTSSTKSFSRDHRYCADDSDPDKRESHNDLERKRRNDLKSSFHTLRSYVPSLQVNEKAAKVVILKKATDYIHELQNAEDNLSKELEVLRIKQKQLLENFVKLKPKVGLLS